MGSPSDQLVLRVWEAVSSERELQGVLAAVESQLAPIVPFQALAVITFVHTGARPFALRIAGAPAGFAGRPKFGAHPPVEGHASMAYRDSELDQHIRQGRPYYCADLLARKKWLPHEFRLAAVGVRAYVAVPLMVRGTQIGLACFTRNNLNSFSPDQVQSLADVSRAIGVAVANALANEEIRTLRDQLEAENISLRTELSHAHGFEEIVGDSPALRKVLETVRQVAATTATVLLSGETGTGKELVARALHRLSPRAQAPLVVVNCAAIPPALLADELFGHERGAFTGAVERRQGRFEQAHGGTLFLDEIAELPLEMQAILLRVLQQREFERLGGNKSVTVDVRLVAATNRSLAGEVRQGRFREDLYYRLNVFPIVMPPLRERVEDVAPLAAHFAQRYGERFGRPIQRIERRSLRVLEAYAWPGNIRELENVIERAVILSRHGSLRVDAQELLGSTSRKMPEQLLSLEREAIEAALRRSAGRVAGPKGAAAVLGVPPSTLDSRIERLGIDKLRFRERPPGL